MTRTAVMTWGCLIAVLLVAGGMLSRPRIERIAKVNGFLEVDGRRLRFVDGFLAFDSEPLEWNQYSVRCRLTHDDFTRSQMNDIRLGKWVDLNHQSVPLGFPGPKAGEDGARLSPYVVIEIGPWPRGTLPLASPDLVRMTVGHFTSGFDSIGLGVSQEEVSQCDIKTNATDVSLEVRTAGEQEINGRRYVWDITFSGHSYDDALPMKSR